MKTWERMFSVLQNILEDYEAEKLTYDDDVHYYDELNKDGLIMKNDTKTILRALLDDDDVLDMYLTKMEFDKNNKGINAVVVLENCVLLAAMLEGENLDVVKRIDDQISGVGFDNTDRRQLTEVVALAHLANKEYKYKQNFENEFKGKFEAAETEIAGYGKQ